MPVELAVRRRRTETSMPDDVTDETSTGSEDTDSTTETPNADEALAEAGKRALTAEREAKNEAKRALKPWRDLEREFRMSPEQVREALASRGDIDKQIEQVRREVRSEVLREVNRARVQDKVALLATASFADPADAHLFVDLDEFEVDEDGAIDEEKVKRELADVLRRKPHLAKRQEVDEVDDFDGGARRTVTKPTSMTDLIRETVNAKRGVGAKR
jgi:hypothetical protein